MQKLEYLKKANSFIEDYLLNNPGINTRFTVVHPESKIFDICVYNDYNEKMQSVVCRNCYNENVTYKAPIKDKININFDEVDITTEMPMETSIPDRLRGKIILIDSFEGLDAVENIKSIRIYTDRNLIRIWANPGDSASFTLKLLVFEEEK